MKPNIVMYFSPNLVKNYSHNFFPQNVAQFFSQNLVKKFTPQKFTKKMALKITKFGENLVTKFSFTNFGDILVHFIFTKFGDSLKFSPNFVNIFSIFFSPLTLGFLPHSILQQGGVGSSHHCQLLSLRSHTHAHPPSSYLFCSMVTLYILQNYFPSSPSCLSVLHCSFFTPPNMTL